MTLSTQTPRVVIIGNGTRGPYSVVDADGQVIRLTSTSHLRLTRYDTATTDNDEGTVLILDTDYAMSGTQDSRFFTLDASQDVLSSSERIVAERVQSYIQDLSLTTSGAFNATAVQSRFDKIEEKLQEVKAQLDRKVGIQFADSTAHKALPAPPAVRPTYFYQNADGSIGQSEIPDLDDLNTVLAQVQAGGVFETDRVNIRNYYVDGQTNWTSAIVTAAAAAMSTGKALWFPGDDDEYETDFQNFASSINIILDPGATVKLIDSATMSGDALGVFRLRASNSSIDGGVFDFNRDGQDRAAYNTAGGSAVRSYWGVVALGTSATHIENIRIRTKVINCADFAVGVQYVDGYDIDVEVETSGSGVILKDADGGIVRRARLVDLDNADWEIYPHAFDALNCDGGILNNIDIVNQKGYDTAAGNAKTDYFSGVTISDSTNMSGDNWYVTAKSDLTMAKGVGVSLLGLTKSSFSNITVKRYSSVHFELGALDGCDFTNIFLDGEYMTTSLFAGEAQMGCHVLNQGLYSNLTSRIRRPSINCTFTNMQSVRMLSRGLIVYLGMDCQWIGGKFNGNQYGIDIRSDSTNESFPAPEIQVTSRLKFLGVEARFNEVAGLWNGGSTDLFCENCDFSDNGQAANNTGDALRLSGTLAVATAGYYGNDSSTTVARTRPILSDCTFQDTQSVTSAFGSCDPAAPTIVSVERPELYNFGQTVTVNNGAGASTDLVAQVLDITGDELTLSLPLTNFPLVSSGAHRITTVGTAITVFSSSQAAIIQGRMWIKIGTEYRQVIAIASNGLSGTLAVAFTSNQSAVAFEIVKTEIEQIRSQDYGLYTLSTARDAGLKVVNPNWGAQNKVSNYSLAGPAQIESVINVKDYGAVGDGSTDDTTAITTATAVLLARATYGAAELYFPKGYYKITDEWIFDNSDSSSEVQPIRIRGDGGYTGQGATRILVTPATSKRGLVLISTQQFEIDGIEFISANNNVSVLIDLDADINPKFSGFHTQFKRCSFRPFSGTTPTIRLIRQRNSAQNKWTECWIGGTSQIFQLGDVVDATKGGSGGTGANIFERCQLYCDFEVYDGLNNTFLNATFARSTSTRPVRIYPAAAGFVRNDNMSFINCTQVSATDQNVEAVNFFTQGAGSIGLVVQNCRFDGYVITFDVDGAGSAVFDGNQYNPPSNPSGVIGIRLGSSAKRVRIGAESFEGLTAVNMIPIDDNRTAPRWPLVVDAVLSPDYTFASVTNFETVMTGTFRCEGGLHRITYSAAINVNAAGAGNYQSQFTLGGTVQQKLSRLEAYSNSLSGYLDASAVLNIDGSSSDVTWVLQLKQAAGTASVVEANDSSWSTYVQIEKVTG